MKTVMSVAVLQRIILARNEVNSRMQDFNLKITKNGVPVDLIIEVVVNNEIVEIMIVIGLTMVMGVESSIKACREITTLKRTVE